MHAHARNMHTSNADDLEILRGARAAGGGNWKSRDVSWNLVTRTLFYFKYKSRTILTRTAVRSSPQEILRACDTRTHVWLLSLKTQIRDLE